MSDVLLTIRLPAELAEQAKAANLEIETFIVDSLRRELAGSGIETAPPEVARGPKRMPTMEEVLADIAESKRRLESGEVIPRVWGEFAGEIWMSDDFDDELPDEEWGDLFL